MAKIHGFNKLTLLDYPGRLAEMDSFRDFRIPAEVTTGSFLRIQSNKKEQSLTG